VKDTSLRRSEIIGTLTADPDGFVWIPDESWRLVTTSKNCRQKRCYRDAVAELDRGIHTSRGVRPSWWAYCEDHMYGRRIHDGRVWIRLRADSPAAKRATGER
jgi:hypothetical protein